jgi:hypothetical protein
MSRKRLTPEQRAVFDRRAHARCLKTAVPETLARLLRLWAQEPEASAVLP